MKSLLLVSNNRCISSDNNDSSSRGRVSINTQSQTEERRSSRRIDNKRNYNILDTREYVYEKTTLLGESRECCTNILDTKEIHFNHQTKTLRNNSNVSDTQLSKLLLNKNKPTTKVLKKFEKATTRKTSTFNDEYHKAWIFRKWHILHTKKNILSLKCNVHDIVKETTASKKEASEKQQDEQAQEQEYVFDLSLISFNINPSLTDEDAYPPPLVQLDDATPYSDDLSPISDDDFSSISDDEKQYQQTLKSLNNQFTSRLRNRNNSSNKQNLNDEDCEDKDNVNTTTTDELNNSNKIKEDSYYERRLSRYISAGGIGGNSNSLFNIRKNNKNSKLQANVAFHWTEASNDHNYSTSNHHLSSVSIAVL